MSVSRVRENRMHGPKRRREALQASRANTRRTARPPPADPTETQRRHAAGSNRERQR